MKKRRNQGRTNRGRCGSPGPPSGRFRRYWLTPHRVPARPASPGSRPLRVRRAPPEAPRAGMHPNRASAACGEKGEVSLKVGRFPRDGRSTSACICARRTGFPRARHRRAAVRCASGERRQRRRAREHALTGRVQFVGKKGEVSLKVGRFPRDGRSTSACICARRTGFPRARHRRAAVRCASGERRQRRRAREHALTGRVQLWGKKGKFP